MLYRVRARLPDTPGTLAAVAQACGRAYVNILGVYAYQADEGTVTDDFVVDAPERWTARDLEDLIRSAGGNGITVTAASQHDVGDETSRWLAAALAVVGDPASLDAQIDGLSNPALPATGVELGRVSLLRRIAEAAAR